MSPGTILSKIQCPSTTDEQKRTSEIPYASTIGSIMYAMICTHPDVFFALSVTSRYQSCRGEGHCIAVMNILKYLRRTKDVFLVFGGEEELVVKGYTDAGFQTDKDDSRSQVGFIFCLNGGAKPSILQLWKLQRRQFGAKILSASSPLDLYCDNIGAIAQAKEPRSHQKSKHIL
ncbi:hypothetical protein U9M48_003574, partial [Paspalum notatum var. saurae]